MATGIDVGCIVTLYDYTENEKVTYEIIGQTIKTHYIGGGWDNHGNYGFRSKVVLDHGGNGIDTISLESPLGKLLKGKDVGDIIRYQAPNGVIEKFKILEMQKNDAVQTGISKDSQSQNDIVQLHDANALEFKIYSMTKREPAYISEEYRDSLLIWIDADDNNEGPGYKFTILLEYKDYFKRCNGMSEADSIKGAMLDAITAASLHITKSCNVVVVSWINIHILEAYHNRATNVDQIVDFSEELSKRNCSLSFVYYVKGREPIVAYIRKHG